MKEAILKLGAVITDEWDTKNMIGDFPEHYITFSFMGIEYIYSTAETKKGKSYCLTYFDKKDNERILYAGGNENECRNIIIGLKNRKN